jgi:U1 small nuclear ribonucleoprotein
MDKDERDRGPDKLVGVGPLIKRIREEADDEEIRKGKEEDERMEVETATAPAIKTEPTNGSSTKMEVDEDGEVKEDRKAKGKGKKKDAVAQAGVVGQEAIKMRRDLRKKRQAEYKKNLEANCKRSVARRSHVIY